MGFYKPAINQATFFNFTSLTCTGWWGLLLPFVLNAVLLGIVMAMILPSVSTHAALLPHGETCNVSE